MDGKQLKNSILQWAIQGKLVPQNPKDEPAQKLLEKIALSRHSERSEESSKRSKKASTSLRGAKATKQSKALSSRIYRENDVWYEQIGTAAPKDITDEIPFEIPETWAWCRLKDVVKQISAGGDKPEKCVKTPTEECNIPIYSNGETNEGLYGYTNVARIFEPSLTVSGRGTIGYTCVRRTPYVPIVRLITIIPTEIVTLEYLQKALSVLIVQAAGIGTSIPQLTVPMLAPQLFPLPPLAEQKRIVAKLEQVLPLAEEYGAAQEQLDKLNKELPEALKKSILQEAIQGKLVPQNPKDEPAQKLLERIAASRNGDVSPWSEAIGSSKNSKKALSTSLRGAKATKQSKNPPFRIYRENGVWYEQIGTATPKDISDEIPFEIPENWVWARWGELSDSIQYGYNAPALQSGRIKMVRISDIHDNKIEWSKVPYCQIKESEIPTYLLQKNDILFARTGGTVGKSYLVGDISTEAVYAGYLIRTRYNSELLSPQYLKFFMESSFYWEQLREGTIATAQPNCNGKTLGKMLLPLPPLAEQKRIVAKLEQLFKVIC